MGVYSIKSLQNIVLKRDICGKIEPQKALYTRLFKCVFESDKVFISIPQILRSICLHDFLIRFLSQIVYSIGDIFDIILKIYILLIDGRHYI